MRKGLHVSTRDDNRVGVVVLVSNRIVCVKWDSLRFSWYDESELVRI